MGELDHHTKLANEVECYIDRNDENLPGMAVLKTYGGRILLMVPAEKWTDTQILTALKFANEAFPLGSKTGELKMAREIKGLLKIE